MRTLKIKDIGRVVSGSTPKTDKGEYWNGDIPWVTPKEMGQLNSQYLYDTERKITELGFKSCSTTLIPKNNVLFTSRAPIGLVAVNKIDVCTNQGFKSIILNEGFDALYVYYYLKSKRERLNNLGTGTTFRELSKTTFEKFEIPVPNYKDQIRIATLLSKVEALITQREESIRLLDEYIKSVFLEMFGDPINNPKSLPVKTFEQIASEERNSIVDGPFGSSLKNEDYFDNGIPIIRINNIRDEGFYASDFKYINESKYLELIRSKVEFGDILIARVGNTIGKTCVFDQKFKALLSTTGVAKITLNAKIANINFISQQLRLPQYIKYIWNQTEGGGQPYLNLTKIRNLKILVPSIEKQTQYSLLVEKINALKKQSHQSLKDLENLFGCLNQLAFKGQLDLNRIKSKFIDDEIERVVKSSKQTKSVDLQREKEKEEDTRYGDPFEVSEATAKKQGARFYNEWLRLHGKTSDDENQSVWLLSKRNGFAPNPVKFTAIEGNAIIDEIFTKQNLGFDYKEFEAVLNNEKITHTAKEVKNFIFQKLEQKQLVQYYASREWLEAIRHPKFNPPGGPEFSGEGSIWFLVNKTEKAG